MRDEGRDVDEVAGAGLGHELELVAPAHAGLAANDVDYALDRAMMMRAGLGLGVDDDGAGPEFLGAGARVGDGGGAVQDRKSTRLNSSHSQISYAVFCLKKKNKTT